MKRFYYLTDTLGSTESISDDLHDAGVTDWNFHVLSTDVSGLVKHHVHCANILHRQDLVHSGEQGALLGVVIGLCVGATLMLAEPFGIALDAFGIAAVILFFTLFCTWMGGFIGISRENYKIKPFHNDLAAGKYLIMVDFRKGMEDKIKDIMQKRHPEARYAREDTTWMNPFKLA